MREITIFRLLGSAPFGRDEEVYIIGGASIYEQAMELADRLCLTIIHHTPEKADAYFPPYDNGWTEAAREDHDTDERHAHSYSFVDFVKLKNEN